MSASSRSKGTLAMRVDAPERDRKAEHIQLALDDRMQLRSSWFDEYAFEHQGLPEIDFANIDTSTTFLGRRLAAPLLISCMTGGTDEATQINRNLARAAEETRVAVGIGSQRKAFEDPATLESFRIRPFAPSVPLLANLGAVQLNYGFGVKECRQAVEMIEADALVLHLNPLQEAIQPEGQCNFAGLLDKVAEVAGALEVPVIVKEIGCGISLALARELKQRGIDIIDTAGHGGTSWARIEAARAGDAEIGERFAEWGIPTPLSIRQLAIVPGLTVIGSGGLRHGIDLAKAIALGADVGGMAWQFLKAGTESKERVVEKIQRTVHELKISMFCAGSETLNDLKRAQLIRTAV
jgi:isopentenyl-diphosphate delta-isomerase